ncbi:DUF2950 family protein [Aminobacter sp. AP02]|uniref:DUF2950 family protein n=1 Tax=Aminobacter sp. AP02 TaxID=2135737 RepID=UPI000D6C5DB5|nr:DUF2950 family protein [Aminobacter sp. AP02]PWK63509.1 Protein of unknown function (DUF2950) [Aminobacter sp. AP02]
MKTSIHRMLLGSVCAAGILTGLALAAPAFAEDDIDISAFAAAEDPPVFDTPAAATEAFKAALANDKLDDLAKVLGLDAAKLRTDNDTLDTFEQIRQGAAKQVVAKEVGDRTILNIGERLWPLPFPITKGSDGKWAFDTFAGLEEIINRRVGENELQAIETMRGYLDAQNEYAQDDHDGDGVLEYAQKLISSEGLTDGLYWPAELGAGDSPAGDLVDPEALDKAKQGEGYFGYRFRILTGQGDHIAGGAHDYVINGNMIAGFGLIAWPVKYAETGVKTFAINQQGIVYEVDLGPATEDIVKYIDRFNPDDSWDVVSNGD